MSASVCGVNHHKEDRINKINLINLIKSNK
jgi:hypothetical protein